METLRFLIRMFGEIGSNQTADDVFMMCCLESRNSYFVNCCTDMIMMRLKNEKSSLKKKSNGVNTIIIASCRDQKFTLAGDISLVGCFLWAWPVQQINTLNIYSLFLFCYTLSFILASCSGTLNARFGRKKNVALWAWTSHMETTFTLRPHEIHVGIKILLWDMMMDFSLKILD